MQHIVIFMYASRVHLYETRERERRIQSWAQFGLRAIQATNAPSAIIQCQLQITIRDTEWLVKIRKNRFVEWIAYTQWMKVISIIINGRCPSMNTYEVYCWPTKEMTKNRNTPWIMMIEMTKINGTMNTNERNDRHTHKYIHYHCPTHTPDSLWHLTMKM